jgi:phosphatidylethanolamine/phosphatidyl-N-methylethanolamine N-methyltransferase
MPSERIYTLWAPIYDPIWERLFRRPRTRTIELLAMQPGESLLIVGIGTGQDIPCLPQNIQVTGIDLNADMLARARQKVDGRQIDLRCMDAQQLELPSSGFDAVLCNLILSVAPDGRRSFEEAWRVLKPGGRLVIFDKFIPEGRSLSLPRRVLGAAMFFLGTDPNRRLEDIIGPLDDGRIVLNEPGLFNGQYRIIRLEKPIT